MDSKHPIMAIFSLHYSESKTGNMPQSNAKIWQDSLKHKNAFNSSWQRSNVFFLDKNNGNVVNFASFQSKTRFIVDLFI